MSCFPFHKSALMGLLLFGVPLLSQAQTTSTTTPSITVTSGIVGVNSAQSARLNVLNMQPQITGVTAPACPVTLELYDDSGNLLKQMPVTTVPPGAAVNLVFKPTVSGTAANARAQIRAVVVTPVPTITPVVVSGGTTAIPAIPACTLLPSLEITNDTSGMTQILTTDFRVTPTYIIPVAEPLQVMK